MKALACFALTQIMSDKALYKDKRAFGMLNFCKVVTRRLFARMMPKETTPAEAEDAAESEAGGDKQEERVRWEAEWERTRAAYRRRAEAEAGSMMFVELLFWKDRSSAKEVRRQHSSSMRGKQATVV
eukprot:scaffold121554_cov37-Prasinocladus_malaysianus.AAC.2